MEETNWVAIERVPGDLQSEILRGLLEAQGIPVLLSQEGAGRAIGLSVGPLGEVEILVPEPYRQQALQVLADFRAGLFELDDDAEEAESEGEEAQSEENQSD
jgi:hypothetical protein